MALALALTGTATASGIDADGFVTAGVGTATASAVGFAALGNPTPPGAGVPPAALRLELVTKTGVQLVSDVTRTRLEFLVEHNGSGLVEFDAVLDQFDDGVDDDALGPDTLVRVHYGDLASWPQGVAEGVVMAAPPVKDEHGRWHVTFACPGSWDLLDLGVLWPPAGATGDTREFSYTAGQTGPSWVPDQWGTPYGYKVKRSWRWRKRWPRGWPESQAQWLWSSSPEKSRSDGTRQFVGTLTLSAAKYVRFYVAGDDNLRFYINGAKAKVKAAGAWKKTTVFTRRLPAGTHTITAAVTNVAGGDNRSGFACAVAEMDGHGNRVRWLLRSTTSTFQYRKASGYMAQVPLPPNGWYAPAVLWQHVSEAAARGVDFHPQMTCTFNGTSDSSGSAWTVNGPVEYDIGISGAELGEKIRAGSVDMAMLPGLRLSAWKHRGFDLRERVVVGKPVRAGWSSRAWPRVRTVGLTHYEAGWGVTSGDSSVAAEYGRRELTISGGGVETDQQAQTFAGEAMRAAGSPEETLEVVISSVDTESPQPFRDFNVADIISVAAIDGYVPMKVMSIRGSEQANGMIQFTIAGYPV